MTWKDNSFQYYPWMHRNVAAWRNLTPPLWDFSTDCGTNYSGEMQTGAFYPVNILWAWLTGLATQRALDILVLLHVAISWVGMTFFLRAYRLSLTSALFGGAVFALIGPVAARAGGQANIYHGLVWMPWVAAALKRAVDDSRFNWRSPWLWAASLFWSMSCLAGHPQPFIHTALLVACLIGAMVFARMWDRWRDKQSANRQDRECFQPAILLGVCIALTILGTAVQILSSHEYFKDSYRWVNLPKPVSGLQTVPWASYTIYTMDWAGFRTLLMPSSKSVEHGNLYLTHVALFFGFVGLWSGRRLALFSVLLAVLSILIALGPHTPMGWLSYITPIINKVREPSRALCLYQFAMATLAALGLARLESILPKTLVGRSVLGTTALLLFCIQVKVLPRGTMLSDSPQAARQYYQESARKPLLDLLLQESARENGMYRVATLPRGLVPPNIGHVYPLATMLGYRSSFNREYFDFVKKKGPPTSPKWDEMSIRWLVSDKIINSPKLLLLYQEPDAWVYQRTDAMPILHQLTDSGKRLPVELSKIHWGTNDFTATVNLKDTARLIFGENAFPGWKAWIDGKRTDVRKAGIFIRIKCPPGEHHLQFAYRPRWFQIGMMGWTMWALTLIAVLVWNKLVIKTAKT